LECTINEVAVGETMAPNDHAVMESLTLEVTVAVNLAMEVVGISTVAASALVMVSLA
jgi:hypothetical protein